MNHIPRILNCAAVRLFATLERVDPSRPTGTKSISRPRDSVSQLAICQRHGAEGYEVYYCDSTWNTLDDKHFDNLDAALTQAGKEYPEIIGKWIEPIVAAKLAESGGWELCCAFCGKKYSNLESLTIGDHAAICNECIARLHH